MFATVTDITELTDYQVHKKQCEWLRNNGFRFVVGASGKPKVLRSEIDRVLLGGVKSKISSPNFKVLNG